MISDIIVINEDWGLGIGDWGLGIGPNPQSPIPNPQSPIPIILLLKFFNIKNFNKAIKQTLNLIKIFNFIKLLLIIKIFIFGINFMISKTFQSKNFTWKSNMNINIREPSFFLWFE